jgi:hypothetical protein
MPYIDDNVQADVADLGSILSPGDSWDGYTIVPVEMQSGSGIKITATTNRDIMCKVAGMMIPFDSLTVGTTENIAPLHGASRARGYALPGGDIDSNYSVEFGTWLSKGEADALREALFAGPQGQAVYHTVVVTFLGDPAKGHAGRHKLVTLAKCKAKSDSWTFSQGSPNKGKFDALALDMYWFGRGPG